MFNKIVLILIISGFINAQDEQKVVLITGTAYGIGKSTAELLIDKGHIVYGGDILVEENLYLNDIGGTALEMDVTNQEHIDKAINQIISEQGRVDVLVNNAGLGVYGAIEDVSMEDIYYQYDVNLFGLARVTKAVLPHMREKESGLIINISSVLGETYGPLAGWYLSTKHALEGWSDALRVELKEFDIDVVVVQPGAINTNFSNVTKTYIDKYRENSAYQHLYGEPITDTGNDVLSNQSDPIVIAKVINKAMNARNPKTRYAAGAYSKIGIFLRKIMTDKMFDRFILFISD
ncbi:MAG: oxidoreductase [Candidatus Neomarinimicrobiota bacterium]|jgi:NAD(P)-dependent dehydrogenase (short-subunit alcohol dehydrogenase family)|tara:strand:+ start:703 stop:1575 length:873 start_codon:yes stop_codon:yes gene_type:complete